MNAANALGGNLTSELAIQAQLMGLSNRLASKPANSELYSALMAARKKLTGIIAKGGTNSAQKYKYVGHEDVLDVTRGILLDAGLLLIEKSVKYVGTVQSGDKGYPNWEGVFVLLHEPSGESLGLTYQATTVGNDKAAFVASTALDRVAHLRILQLAGSGDHDVKPYVEDAESDHSGTDATLREQQQQSRVESEQLKAALETLNAVPDVVKLAQWRADFGRWEAPKRDKDIAMERYLVRSLEMAKTEGQLYTWFEELDEWNGNIDVKQKAARAFQAKANELGIKGSLIAAAVRERNVEKQP